MARIDQLLDYTRKAAGSDLHISVGCAPLVRLHGELKPMSKGVLGQQDTIRLLAEILSDEQRHQFAEKNKCA